MATGLRSPVLSVGTGPPGSIEDPSGEEKYLLRPELLMQNSKMPYQPKQCKNNTNGEHLPLSLSRGGT